MIHFRIIFMFLFSLSLFAEVSPKANCYQFYKNENTYSLKAKKNLNEFELVFQRGRGLHSYISALGKDFKDKLTEMENQDRPHWIDAGGGDGNALLQYHSTHPTSKVQSTLVSLESFAEPSEKVRVLKGRYIENIPHKEFIKADLITDVFGPMAYSSEPDKVLAKYLEILKPDGEIHIFLGSKEEIFGRNNQFITTHNQLLDFIEWLQSIPGLEISPRKEAREDDMIPFEVWSVKIKKRSDHAVKVPKLQVRSFKNGAPPEFLFQEVKDFKALSVFEKQQQQSYIQKILQEKLSDLSLTLFFDQFRSGEMTHPLLKLVSSLKENNTWLNLTSAEINLAPALLTKDFDFSNTDIFWGLAQKWMAFRSRFLTPQTWNYQQLSQLVSQTSKSELITDYYGPFVTNLEPDKVLSKYLQLAEFKAPILIHLGKEFSGFGDQSQVILKTGGKLSLRKWLLNIPDLDIRFYRGGYAWSGGAWTFVKIINSQPGIPIPPLKVIGIGKSTDLAPPAIIFEEL